METVPLPPDISTNAGNTGLYGSLIDEVLTYANLKTKVHGKTVGYNRRSAARPASARGR